MFWMRLFVGIFVFLLIIYYATVIAQSLGVITFTDEDISPLKGLVPFYYWRGLFKKDKNNKNNQNK